MGMYFFGFWTVYSRLNYNYMNVVNDCYSHVDMACKLLEKWHLEALWRKIDLQLGQIKLKYEASFFHVSNINEFKLWSWMI